MNEPQLLNAIITDEMLADALKHDAYFNRNTLDYFGYTYDCALPQQWVDGVTKDVEVSPVGQFVWLYTTSNVNGEPYPVTDRGMEITNTLVVLGGK